MLETPDQVLLEMSLVGPVTFGSMTWMGVKFRVVSVMEAVCVNLTPLASSGTLETAVFSALVSTPASHAGSNPALSGSSRTGYTWVFCVVSRVLLLMC